jgi:hypothetical protein
VALSGNRLIPFFATMVQRLRGGLVVEQRRLHTPPSLRGTARAFGSLYKIESGNFFAAVIRGFLFLFPRHWVFCCRNLKFSQTQPVLCYNARMQWNDATQDQFNKLRVKKFAQQLDATEQTELASMLTHLEQQSQGYLSPLIASLEQENSIMLHKLNESRQQNSTLVQLIDQQERLVADARHWLTDFERRH